MLYFIAHLTPHYPDTSLRLFLLKFMKLSLTLNLCNNIFVKESNLIFLSCLVIYLCEEIVFFLNLILRLSSWLNLYETYHLYYFFYVRNLVLVHCLHSFSHLNALLSHTYLMVFKTSNFFFVLSLCSSLTPSLKYFIQLLGDFTYFLESS